MLFYCLSFHNRTKCSRLHKSAKAFPNLGRPRRSQEGKAVQFSLIRPVLTIQLVIKLPNVELIILTNTFGLPISAIQWILNAVAFYTYNEIIFFLLQFGVKSCLSIFKRRQKKLEFILLTSLIIGYCQKKIWNFVYVWTQEVSEANKLQKSLVSKPMLRTNQTIRSITFLPRVQLHASLFLTVASFYCLTVSKKAEDKRFLENYLWYAPFSTRETLKCNYTFITLAKLACSTDNGIGDCWKIWGEFFLLESVAKYLKFPTAILLNRKLLPCLMLNSEFTGNEDKTSNLNGFAQLEHYLCCSRYANIAKPSTLMILILNLILINN